MAIVQNQKKAKSKAHNSESAERGKHHGGCKNPKVVAMLPMTPTSKNHDSFPAWHG